MAGDEVHVATHRPQEILAPPEQTIFGGVKHAVGDQFLRVAYPINIFGDPKQRMEVAQAALAVLNVRLNKIARLATPAEALLAFSKFGSNKLRRRALDHLLVEPHQHIVEQRTVAEQESRFQDRSTDSHVGFGKANALVSRARSMADLESHIPQTIENSLSDLLAPGCLFVGQ